jgi:hypothetical protein
MIKLAHPAGMKYFKKLALRTDVDFVAVISRILSREKINLFDEIFTLDQSIITTNKTLVDLLTPTELNRLLNLTKILSDSFAATETQRLFQVGKILDDTQLVQETLINKIIGKIIDDTIISNDNIISKALTKSVVNETIIVNDGNTFTMVEPYTAGTQYWETGYTSLDFLTLEIT